MRTAYKKKDNRFYIFQRRHPKNYNCIISIKPRYTTLFAKQFVINQIMYELIFCFTKNIKAQQ